MDNKELIEKLEKEAEIRELTNEMFWGTIIGIAICIGMLTAIISVIVGVVYLVQISTVKGLVAILLIFLALSIVWFYRECADEARRIYGKGL